MTACNSLLPRLPLGDGRFPSKACTLQISTSHAFNINGDHNIPAAFKSLETEGGITKTLKIRQIEPEFLSRMFAMEEV